ncbi:MAG TPA: hypothetical protein VM597_40505 [Gemmataceae bacterium]|jgi:DNA-binding NtrC family response regulator|nr:hypothetical protein [Gemmataceae bacterium]
MDPTTLILEADPAVRRLVRHGLARHGLTAREAGAGPAAVAALGDGSWPVRAIVIGQLVPGLDGVALAHALQRARPGVRLFFFCGHSVEPELFDVPDIDVYFKPHGLRELCAVVADRCHAPAQATAASRWAGAASSSAKV